MINYKVKNVINGETYVLDQNQLLHEINRDRSEHFSEYTANDLSSESNIVDALSLTDLEYIQVFNGDRCPFCNSDNIANEDDTEMVTCHDCSEQF